MITSAVSSISKSGEISGYSRATVKRFVIILALLSVAVVPVNAKDKPEKQPKKPGPFEVALLEGGRHLDYISQLSSEQDLHTSRGFFSKMIDVIAGAPNWRRIIRPYSVITDSRGRILVTDPGIPAVHIFDFDKKKYTLLTGGKKDDFKSPIGIAVDADDNIYVTDSQLGKVLVFDSRGKYQRSLGDLKGEGFYKRPTGIAIDKAEKKIYLTDTLRDRIYVTDLSGKILKDFGSRGTDPGQFNFPTEVRVTGDEILVVDAMNFRVQVFDHDGKFRAQFGQLGDGAGEIFRPKGISVDSEGNVYLVDAASESVQTFRRDGQFLFYFGRTGSNPAEFELPSGLWIDAKDRVFVADSYNHRVQIFQYVAASHEHGGQQ